MMMTSINETYTWGNWLGTFVLIALLYITIRVAIQLVQQYVSSSTTKRNSLKVLKAVYTVYEPLAICILLVSFVLINPIVHGLLLLALFIIFYTVLRKYLFGRLLMFTSNLREGQHIRVRSNEGSIQQLNKLGLLLKTNQGNQRIYYDTIMTKGYTLLRGKEVRQIYELQIAPLKEDQNITQYQIEDKLLTCTFLDWNNQPNIESIGDNKFKIWVQTLEERHFNYLVTLLSEDYQCKAIA